MTDVLSSRCHELFIRHMSVYSNAHGRNSCLHPDGDQLTRLSSLAGRGSVKAFSGRFVHEEADWTHTHSLMNALVQKDAVKADRGSESVRVINVNCALL